MAEIKDFISITPSSDDYIPVSQGGNTRKSTITNLLKPVNDKIGDLTGNGLTEADLATAIKNDRSQLSHIPKKKINEYSMNRPNRTLIPAMDKWNLVDIAIKTDATWKNNKCGVGYDVVWDDEYKVYAMVYSGMSEGGTLVFGLAFSDDGITWNDYASNPIFTQNTDTNQPDCGGITFPQLVRYDNQWIIYYVGFPGYGFEQGTPSICYATASSLTGTWTRHGSVADISMFPSEENIVVMYRPCVVEFGDKWYMFINAGSAIGHEEVWCFENDTPYGQWENPVKVAPASSFYSGNLIASDPDVIRFGDVFIMCVWCNDSIHLAYSELNEFPYTWHPTTYKVTGIENGAMRPVFVNTKDKLYMYVNNYSENRIKIYETYTPNKTIYNNAGSHNSIFRGKDLTELYTPGQIADRIAYGTFKDLYVGDYFDVTITTSVGGTETVRLILAGFNTYLKCGDTSLAQNHAVIVPKDCFVTKSQMNATAVTDGGYAGSYINSTLLALYQAGLASVIGESRILSYRASMSNAVTSGKSSARDWYDCKLRLMNECEVYGNRVYSSSPNDVGMFNLQLPLFRLAPQYKQANKGNSPLTSWWLSDVADATNFSAIYERGDAVSAIATNYLGVRPCFLLG